jgi:hypothetical protein
MDYKKKYLKYKTKYLQLKGGYITKLHHYIYELYINILKINDDDKRLKKLEDLASNNELNDFLSKNCNNQDYEHSEGHTQLHIPKDINITPLTICIFNIENDIIYEKDEISDQLKKHKTDLQKKLINYIKLRSTLDVTISNKQKKIYNDKKKDRFKGLIINVYNFINEKKEEVDEIIKEENENEDEKKQNNNQTFSIGYDNSWMDEI